jgi:hypothetical protein
MSHRRFSQISLIHDFIKLAELIEQIDQDSLVLFDVDDVLIMDQDEYRLTHPYRHEQLIERKQRLARKERHLLYSIVLKERAVRLVDPYISDILGGLWKRAIPTLALTKLYTGKFGIIDDFTNWRINELNNMKIDFTKSAPIKEEILVDELDIGSGVPQIKQGIILTADADKGWVLENILHRTKYYPKTIIFIDDLLENIESVAKICDKLRINFYGLEYKGASLIPQPELNRESEKIRFEILENQHRWLTNFKL